MSRTRTGAPPRDRRAHAQRRDRSRRARTRRSSRSPRREGIEIPTMCWERTLTPVNACRVCVVEVKGSRVLVPVLRAQGRGGHGGPDRTPSASNLSRKMVIEFLASSVDLSVMPNVDRWIEEYGADPERYGPPAPPFEAGERDRLRAGHHETPDGSTRPPCTSRTKVDNELYVRDYSKCILCYKCVEGCGTDWQNTFAIAVAGRGFDARIATEFANPLPDSACVYCGNCIAVCPTGALMFKSEYDMREAGTWDEERQTQTTDDLHVLRRRLQPGAARAGQRDRQGHLAARSSDDAAATCASRAASASSSSRTTAAGCRAADAAERSNVPATAPDRRS